MVSTTQPSGKPFSTEELRSRQRALKSLPTGCGLCGAQQGSIIYQNDPLMCHECLLSVPPPQDALCCQIGSIQGPNHTRPARIVRFHARHEEIPSIALQLAGADKVGEVCSSIKQTTNDHGQRSQLLSSSTVKQSAETERQIHRPGAMLGHDTPDNAEGLLVSPASQSARKQLGADVRERNAERTFLNRARKLTNEIAHEFRWSSRPTKTAWYEPGASKLSLT